MSFSNAGLIHWSKRGKSGGGSGASVNGCTAGLVEDAPSTKYINERMGKLKELASESIHGVKHPIFHDKTEEQLTEKTISKKQ